MKILTVIALCVLMWSNQAMAVQICNASVTASTPTVAFVDNGNGTVTHTKTGLLWKRCSEGQIWNGATCTGMAITYGWQSVLQHVQALNTNGGYAGFNDWRIPNIKELSSIVEDQCGSPAINVAIFSATATGVFSNIITLGYFSNSPQHRCVSFSYGGEVCSATYVRLVRGGQ